MLEFEKQAVAVRRQQFFRRVLLRQMVFLKNPDLNLLAVKELVCNPALQIHDIFSMDQTRTLDVHANQTAVSRHGDAVYLHHPHQFLHLIRHM